MPKAVAERHQNSLDLEETKKKKETLLWQPWRGQEKLAEFTWRQERALAGKTFFCKNFSHWEGLTLPTKVAHSLCIAENDR